MCADLFQSRFTIKGITVEYDEGAIEQGLCGEKGVDGTVGLFPVVRGALKGVADGKGKEFVTDDLMDVCIGGIGNDEDDCGDILAAKLADGEFEKGFAVAADGLEAFGAIAESGGEACGEVDAVKGRRRSVGGRHLRRRLLLFCCSGEDAAEKEMREGLSRWECAQHSAGAHPVLKFYRKKRKKRSKRDLVGARSKQPHTFIADTSE